MMRFPLFAIVLLTFGFGGCRTELPDIGWKGRCVAVLGDSITDPNQSHAIYWQYLGAWLDWDVHSYGVGGATWADIPAQIDQMEKDLGDNVDAILIFMGTNDYNKNRPLGQWYDVASGEVNWKGKTVKLDRRSFNRDVTTMRGAANVAMDRLKSRYSRAQIVVMTPIHRAFFQCSETNVQPSEEWPNVGGFYIDAYVNAVKELGNVWSVPVIDLNADSGLFPLKDEATSYFRNAMNDRLHPNGIGHERLAKVIYARLRALPATF